MDKAKRGANKEINVMLKITERERREREERGERGEGRPCPLFGKINLSRLISLTA